MRGNLQALELDFDPTEVYVHVTSHESIRHIVEISEAEELICEGGYVDNAKL